MPLFGSSGRKKLKAQRNAEGLVKALSHGHSETPADAAKTSKPFDLQASRSDWT